LEKELLSLAWVFKKWVEAVVLSWAHESQGVEFASKPYISKRPPKVMSFKQASSVNACLHGRRVRPDGMAYVPWSSLPAFWVFHFDVKLLASLLPARLFGLYRDLHGIIIITVTATPRRPGATTPLHTDHNPTHMYTDVATCVSLPRKIGQSTRACVSVCVASVRPSKSSEGTNATQASWSEGVFCKRRLPLHRVFLGFLVCSQSGDHPWKPFLFFLAIVCCCSSGDHP
jgi:hypothetical protein